MAEAKSVIEKIDAAMLDQLSAAELTALIERAEAKRREKLDAAKEEVLSEARAKLADLGLTLEDALAPAPSPAGTQGRKRRSDGGGKVPAKYRGPGGEEWTGRGRAPRWLAALEAEGRSREEFLVRGP